MRAVQVGSVVLPGWIELMGPSGLAGPLVLAGQREPVVREEGGGSTRKEANRSNNPGRTA